jgi:uncharacterized membrane protein
MATNAPFEPNRGHHQYGWVIVIIIGVIFFATNPSEPQFKQYIKNDLISQSRSEGGSLSGALMELLAGPTTYLSTTVRSEYYLFSIYEIDILGDKYKYIGIFNHFIRFNK